MELNKKSYFDEKLNMKFRLYTLIIIILIIFIGILLTFIIFFSIEISDEKDLINSELKIIQSKTKLNNDLNKQTSKQLVNLKINHEKRIIQTIYSKDEYNIILQWTNPSSEKVDLCYKESLDENITDGIEKKCLDGTGIIVIVKTDRGKRFGGFLPILDFRMGITPTLFSLSTLMYFKPMPGGNTHSVEEGKLIKFGDDLVISRQCRYNKNSYSKFPHDYGKASFSLKDLIDSKDKNFQVDEVEVLKIRDEYS